MEHLPSFAAYFNSLAWLLQSGPRYLLQFPMVSVGGILLSSIVAVITSGMFVRAILGQLANVAQPNPNQGPLSICSLPAFLKLNMPPGFERTLLYLPTIGTVVIILLVTDLTLVQKLFMQLNIVFGLDLPTTLLIFVVCVLIIIFCPDKVMRDFHVMCVALNLASALLKNSDATYVSGAEGGNEFEALRRFMVQLSIPLLIPSTTRFTQSFSGRSIKLAIGLVSFLYLCFGWLLITGALPFLYHYFGPLLVACALSFFLYRCFGLSIVIGAVSFLLYCCFSPWVVPGFLFEPTSIQARSAVTLPCVVANFHIVTRALTDTVLAWRYSVDYQEAVRLYPNRVRCVEVLTPVCVVVAGYAVGILETEVWAYRVHWAHPIFLLGVLLPILAYYSRQSLRAAAARQSALWAQLVIVCIGGGVVVFVAGYFAYTQSDLWVSLQAVGALVTPIVLWEIGGRYFG